MLSCIMMRKNDKTACARKNFRHNFCLIVSPGIFIFCLFLLGGGYFFFLFFSFVLFFNCVCVCVCACACACVCVCVCCFVCFFICFFFLLFVLCVLFYFILFWGGGGLGGEGVGFYVASVSLWYADE